MSEQEELLLYPPASAVTVALVLVLKFTLKIFYVMGKVLSGELFCMLTGLVLFYISAPFVSNY